MYTGFYLIYGIAINQRDFLRIFNLELDDDNEYILD